MIKALYLPEMEDVSLVYRGALRAMMRLPATGGMPAHPERVSIMIKALFLPEMADMLMMRPGRSAGGDVAPSSGKNACTPS